MLIIWGRITSINVQKVVWVARELGLPFERRDAGRQFGVVDSQEYRQINPMGKVPTIVEDGFILYESDAILRYLAAKFGAGDLWPHDERVRARADQWSDWQSKEFSPSLMPAFFGILRTAPEKRDPVAIAESLAAAGAKMAVLDRHLATTPYVAGDRFTYGDITAGLAVHRWLNLPIERPNMIGITTYYAKLKQRAASSEAFHLPVE